MRCCILFLVFLIISPTHLVSAETKQAVNNTTQQDRFTEQYVLANKGDTNAQNKVALCYLKGDGVTKDLAKAFTWFEKAASRNHPEAQFYYARFVLNGTFTEKSPEKALQWFKKSADQGFVDAQNSLGILYMVGLGTTIDYQESSKWNQKAAEAGNAEAMYNLAQLYEKGTGIDKNSKKAIFWYEQSANKGFALSEFEIGVAHAQGLGGYEKNEMKAMDWYEKAAKKGISVAQANLAELYLVRINQDNRNIYQAVSWFKKAAEQGLPRPQMLLGLAYLNGEGVARDKPLGLEWINKSSKNGYEPAKKILEDIKQSHEKNLSGLTAEYQREIRNWPKVEVAQLERSANIGDSLSQEHLAIAHQFGLLMLPKNPQIAADWYIKYITVNVGDEYNFRVHKNLGLIYIDGIYQSLYQEHNDSLKAKLKIDALAKGGDLAAIKFLARFYNNLGDGFISLEQAKFWYEKAALAGDLGSQLALARLYTFKAPNEAGVDAQPDYAKVLHWYKKVVIYDRPYAQYELAKLYISRDDSLRNNKEAIDLLKKAADKNIPNAKLDLAIAYKEGKITAQNYSMALQLFQKIATLNYSPNSIRSDDFYISAISIAELYEKGLGSPVNKVQAYAWYGSILESLQRKLTPINKSVIEVTGGGKVPQQMYNPEKDSPTGVALLVGTTSPIIKESEIKRRLSILENNMTDEEIKNAKKALIQWKENGFKASGECHPINKCAKGV